MELTDKIAENLLNRFDWRICTLIPLPLGDAGDSTMVSISCGGASTSITGLKPTMNCEPLETLISRDKSFDE